MDTLLPPLTILTKSCQSCCAVLFLTSHLIINGRQSAHRKHSPEAPLRIHRVPSQDTPRHLNTRFFTRVWPLSTLEKHYNAELPSFEASFLLSFFLLIFLISSSFFPPLPTQPLHHALCARLLFCPLAILPTVSPWCPSVSSRSLFFSHHPLSPLFFFFAHNHEPPSDLQLTTPGLHHRGPDHRFLIAIVPCTFIPLCPFTWALPSSRPSSTSPPKPQPFIQTAPRRAALTCPYPRRASHRQHRNSALACRSIGLSHHYFR